MWLFLGARCASRGCTDPPAGAGGLVHPARILATLVAFASPFRGRSAERTSRRGLISNMVIRGRSVRFSRMYRSPRGCGGIGTPSENIRCARGVRVPVRGRSAERTLAPRAYIVIWLFLGARSASRGCTDPPADAGGLVHPARIELASPAPEASGLSIILWVRMTYVSILF